MNKSLFVFALAIFAVSFGFAQNLKISMGKFDRAWSKATGTDVRIAENAIKCSTSETPVYYSANAMLGKTLRVKFSGATGNGIKIIIGQEIYDVDKERDFVERFELSRINGYWILNDNYLLGSRKYRRDFRYSLRRLYKLSRQYHEMVPYTRVR